MVDEQYSVDYTIEIVAAAASLIRMKLDGFPFLQITVKRSWHSKLRALLGFDHERRVIYHLNESHGVDS